ncbi:MAG: DUF423 domain-containing protein [Ignavibacteriaceae bacterium]|nr:DUF423 domain-containing protein [Ignavibacteriaceae bacterium]
MNKKADKNWIIISAVLGFLGVAFGAFGAHALKKILTPEVLTSFETGVRYHLIHTVVLLFLASRENQKISRILFLTGIILFSFSIYIYALTGIRSIVMITPIGGFFLLSGWLMIIWGEFKKN